MNDADPTREAIGTVIGFAAGCVVVQLADGSEVVCRGVKRIHRIYGCFTPRIGQRFLIRYSRGPERLPLLIKGINDDPGEFSMAVDRIRRDAVANLLKGLIRIQPASFQHAVDVDRFQRRVFPETEIPL